MLEDDRVAEVYLERPERRSIAGNIYLGTVDNVLPGMEAAFVEIGLEKNGFLYVDEIVVPELEGKRHGKKIQDLIPRGQTILVQAVKDPMKTKGARLTTEISLPGRFVVYVPHGEGLGVSRRLDDDERTRLKAILKEIAPKQGGVIVRTAAEGASAEDIERDLDFLQRLWKTIEAPREGREGAGAHLPGGRAAAAGRARPLHGRLRARARRPRPHLQADRRLPEEDLAAHGRARAPLQGEDAADRGLRRRRGDPLDAEPAGRPALGRLPDLRLRRGVHRDRRQHRPLRRLALEDVDRAGSRTRSRRTTSRRSRRSCASSGCATSAGSSSSTSSTWRTRRTAPTVEEALRKELERDRTKTYVVEISPLGLVEMTRQNVTDGPREMLTRSARPAPATGSSSRRRTAAVEVERRLRSLAAGLACAGVQGRAEPAERAAARRARRRRGSRSSRRRRSGASSSSPRKASMLDHSAVLAQGKLEKLRPSAPVAEGAELELKLGEVGLHDAQRRGRQGRRLRRRRRRRREARRQEGEGARRARARRRRLRVAARGRRRRRRRRSRPRARPRSRPARPRAPKKDARRRAPQPRPTREVEASAERASSSRRGAPSRGAGGGRRARPRRTPTAEAPATKKTRRGTRGGRNRKKKPAGSRPPRRRRRRAGTGGTAERRLRRRGRAERLAIHVPAAELDGERAERRRRSLAAPQEVAASPTEAEPRRRGSRARMRRDDRGGRRKKKTRRGRAAGATARRSRRRAVGGADGAPRASRPSARRAERRAAPELDLPETDTPRAATAPSETARRAGLRRVHADVRVARRRSSCASRYTATGSRAPARVLSTSSRLYGLRHHLRRWQAVPRPRGRAAARRPARARRGQDVPARRAAVGGDGET